MKARSPGSRLRASLVCAGGLVAAVAAVALMAALGNLVPHGTARPEAKLLVDEAPAPRARSFAIVNPDSFRPRRAVGLMRVAPFRALYSASLGTDPQQFLQKAPEQGHLGMFRWEEGRERGIEGESLPRAVPARPAPRTPPHWPLTRSPCSALSMQGRMERERGGARVSPCLLRADPVGCQWS